MTDQEDVSVIIGEGSNAIVWPQGPHEDDEDVDEVEQHNNQRLMRLGMYSFVLSYALHFAHFLHTYRRHLL